MSKFLSGRQSNLKLGVAGYTESKTVLETTGKVGIGTTDAQSYSLFVVGDTNVTGLVSATAFYGDGSNLENTGATLSAAAGTQRLVVTSLTSGTMVDAATDSDLTFNATTNTLNTDNLIVAGNLTVSGDQTILNTTQLEVEDINIGIASANPKLNDAQLDGAGITIHGLNGDKTLTWDNSNSRLGFNTDVNVANLKLDDNQKATFGDNDDLQIYHSGTSSLIRDNGAGNLVLASNGAGVKITKSLNSEDLAKFNVDGSVELYYDNSKKFETTGIGVSIYNDLNVGTGVTIYGNAGIVSAISFYGDGSNLTNTGATLSATSGTERLVTTQLTSGTMVDAATDADLTFDAGNNLLHTPKIDAAGLSPDGTNFGISGYVPLADGAGGWNWANLQGASSVNTILNGFTVSEEGNVVGTAGSITQLDFRGVNVLASADPQPNGIATVSFLLNQSLDSLDVSGIATFRGPVSNGSTTGNVGQYLRSTGVGVTWASFPTLRVVGVNTAIAGQTAFNFSYNVDFLDVFVNGVKLTPSEYTATNGNQIVLNTPTFADEVVEFHSYNVASTYGGGGGGGGGASNLNGLTDVTIGTLTDKDILQYQSSSGEWENVTLSSTGVVTSIITNTSDIVSLSDSNGVVTIDVAVGAGGTWATDLVGINTTKNVGIGTTAKDGYKLYVEGDARVTGILTVGPASVTIDGINNSVSCTTVSAGGSVTASQFYGDASNLTNLSSANLTGALPALDASNLTGIVTTNIGKANVTISDNPPGIGTAHGDLWWESDTAKGHIYYNDGSSAQWVEFSPSSGGGGGGGGGSYGNSDVDSHLNVSGAFSGQILSWNGSDYAWVADQTGSGITTANINADTLNVTGVSTFSNDVTFDGATAGRDITFDRSSNTLQFEDWAYAKFGSGSDNLSIYHNGANSIIQNDGSDSGSLYIRVTKDNERVHIQSDNGSGGLCDYFRANGVDGESQLYHYGNLKLATKANGVDVTGTVSATSFSGDGSNLTGIGTVVISDNAPSSPDVGQLWWESDTATGHIYYNDGSTSQWVQFNSGSSGGSGSSGVGTSRYTVSNTTGSLNAGSTTDITISGAKAYSLFKIETSHAAWVRLYTDTTSRTSDASRVYTTDPTPGSGVLAEVYTTTSGSNTFKMTPAVTGWNDDATPSTNIYAKVTNNESSAQDITVTLTILRMED